MPRSSWLNVLLCLALLGAEAAPAATRRAPGGDNQQQHMLQQLQQQTADLQQEKAALAQERDALKAQLAKVTTEKDAAQTAIQRSKDNATALAGRINDLRGKQTQMQTEQQNIRAQLQAALAESKRLNGRIADLDRQQATCRADNRKLYELNVEILDQYRKKGVADALLQREPLTGIKSVEIQNIIQKYRDANDAQLLPAQTSRTP